MGRAGDIDGLVVVVTGASSGIGRATCRALVAAGAHVTAVARREAALRSLREEVRSGPGTLTTATADVIDGDRLAAVVDEVAHREGRLDAWVNNAGVNLYGPLDEVPIDDLHRLLQVNVGGYLNGIRAALPHFREHGAGVLVNVTSVLGFVPGPFQAAYAASKHALHGLTTSLRAELRPDGIDVAEIAPGPVDTPLFHQAGNHMGRVVVPPDPIASAEQVADRIVRSIVRPRATVVVGLQNRLVVLAGRLAPRSSERVAYRMTVRNHFAAAPESARAGNLHQPADDAPTTVDGGWRASGRRTVVAAIAGAATGLFLLRRRG